MPLPVVRLHVAERRVDPSLGGDRVRAGGEQFGDDGRLEALLDEAERGPESRAAGPDHDGVIVVVHDRILAGGCIRRHLGIRLAGHGETKANKNIDISC